MGVLDTLPFATLRNSKKVICREEKKLKIKMKTLITSAVDSNIK